MVGAVLNVPSISHIHVDVLAGFSTFAFVVNKSNLSSSMVDFLTKKSFPSYFFAFLVEFEFH